MIENILLLIAGFFLLIKGADILIDGSSAIAKKFHISSLIIGLTIVAIGTSMPELMICSKSTVLNEYSVTIGNVIGSNICNILFVFGICSIIIPMKISKITKFLEIPISLLLIFTFFILANNGLEKGITAGEGIVLLALFICFIIYTIIIAKYEEIIEPKVELININETDTGIVKGFLYVLAGIVALNFGGDFVVENIVELLEKFNVNERKMSLVFIAFGTSLPELITSINAVLKKNNEMAIGNILGSNFFNMSLVVALSSFFNKIDFFFFYNVDILILFIVTVFLLIAPYIGRKNYIDKKFGIAMVALYAMYMLGVLK